MKKFFVIFFVVYIFLIAYLPAVDTDFGWHYRCGKQFLETRTICRDNNFSYYLPNYRAAYPSLFYDVSLAFVFDHFGFNGLSILYSILVVAAAIIFINLISADLLIKTISFGLIFFLSYSTFGLGIRSQIISFIFFLTTLLILKKSKLSQNYLAILPVLFFFWVNAHIGFFIGLVLIGFHILSETKTKIPIFEILILVLSFISTLINPFGFGVYREVANHAFAPLNTMIAEWTAPPLWGIGLICFLTSILIITGIKNKKINLFQFLLLTVFAFLAINAKRNLPFFYTVFFWIFFDQHQFQPLKKINSVILPILVTMTLFLLVVNIPKTSDFNSSWSAYCDLGLRKYPCLAIKNYPQLSGNVFALYEWGGFLIWKKPKIKVFVDGRMSAWKDENGQYPYQVFINIIQTKPGWNEKLRQNKTNYLLISDGSFLDLLLQKEAKKYGWQEKYRDNISVIYKDAAED